MTITYYGNSCVVIHAKPSIGEVTVVLDLYDNSTGLRLPRTLTADVVFASQPGPVHGNVAAVQGTPFVIERPGEYEVKGVSLDARAASPNGTGDQKVLRVFVENMTIGFLGGLNRALIDRELEILEGVDILILPVGGGDVMDPVLAAETMRTAEPRVVIPVHFEESGLKANLKPLKAFVKEVGSMRTEEGNKFKIQESKLPQDDMLLVLLSRA